MGITSSLSSNLTIWFFRNVKQHPSSFCFQLIPWSELPLDMSLFISYTGSINGQPRVIMWLLDAGVRRGNPTLCLSDINNPSKFPNRASETCCLRKETQPAGIRWTLQNVLLQCPLTLLQCVSTTQQKPKGILACLEKVISFYVMTQRSNCAQNNWFYCLNTFLVLEHPGGFNCACNFADINEGD